MRMRKKIKKSIKLRKPKKNNKKTESWKKNWLEFSKNQLVRFQFYKFETEKTEPNPNRKKLEKKPSQSRKNPSKTEKTEPNQTKMVLIGFCSKITESNRNRSV